jgi:tRNA(Ile)-lysidine synthase
MRLARGAGGEGLAAMGAVRELGFSAAAPLPAQDVSGACPPEAQARAPMVLIRPCLGMSRAELRHHATVLKLPFVDDPSNADPQFDRARMRRLLDLLEAEGLPRGALAGAAERLREDRAVLRGDVARLWQAAGQEHAGWLSLAPDWAEGAAVASQRRLLALALCWVAGRDYAPRAEPLEALRDRVVSGGAGTLHGCELAWVGGRLAVFREYAAVAGLRAEAGLWDGRWRMPESGEAGAPALGATQDQAGAEIRALGEAGWRLLPAEARAAVPHRIARALPVLWRAGQPQAAPRPRWIAPGFARFVVTH